MTKKSFIFLRSKIITYKLIEGLITYISSLSNTLMPLVIHTTTKTLFYDGRIRPTTMVDDRCRFQHRGMSKPSTTVQQ